MKRAADTISRAARKATPQRPRPRPLLILVAIGVVAAVAATSASGTFYYTDQRCINPGEAAVSGWNVRHYNAVQIASTCTGGDPLSGLYYVFTNQTTNTPIWSTCNCGSGPYTFVDTRDASYARAVCKASNSNTRAIYWNYCDSG
jgi:hypothetical protein